MLIDFEYSDSNIITSYIDDKGDIALKKYEYPVPYNFEACSLNDDDAIEGYTTWDRAHGVKKVMVKKPDKNSIYYYLYELPEKERELLFRVIQPQKFFIDIETEIVDGFSEAKDANTRVLSIAIVHENSCFVYGIDPMSKEDMNRLTKDTNEYFEKQDVQYEVTYVQYKEHSDKKGNIYSAEYMMLYDFFNEFVPQMPVITGWNFVDYDWMFLMKRAENIGVPTRNSSPTKKFVPHDDEFIMPRHRYVFDYMAVYKKFQQSVKIKESNALDFVSNKLLGVKKLEYKGTLKDLYKNDFYKFILYNVIDTALVHLIDRNYKYFNIMIAIGNFTRTRISATLKTVEMVEGMMRENLLKKEKIVLTKMEVDDFKAKGGWVKDPVVGMHENLVIFDFASLYPKTMMQFNISPDSYLGMIDSNKEYIVHKWRRIKYDPQEHILTDYGSVFSRKTSINKEIMERTYAMRKEEKKLMKQYKKELAHKSKELALIRDAIKYGKQKSLAI